MSTYTSIIPMSEKSTLLHFFYPLADNKCKFKYVTSR